MSKSVRFTRRLRSRRRAEILEAELLDVARARRGCRARPEILELERLLDAAAGCRLSSSGRDP